MKEKKTMPELLMTQAINHRLQGGDISITEPERTEGGLWAATVTHDLPDRVTTYRAYCSYGAFGMVHVEDKMKQAANAQ